MIFAGLHLTMKPAPIARGRLPTRCDRRIGTAQTDGRWQANGRKPGADAQSEPRHR